LAVPFGAASARALTGTLLKEEGEEEEEEKEGALAGALQ
jgi:hypothetical protein